MPKNIKLDEAGLQQALKSILSEIQDTGEPEELNAYRAVFRKYIPLFSRAYVAAYLLRKMKPSTLVNTSTAPTGRRPKPAPSRPAPAKLAPGNNGSANREPAPSPVPREGMVTLFVGIGRSRRVYPRDLMGLIIEIGGATREQIGAIKILDNYSFVDIETDYSQQLIDKLNGTEFRGRTLAVNFAKKKD